ncbi:MAG: hypothetical protein RMK31_07875, partial [Candidatus Caldarchaeum sp.]|nr:hypothetical protein [Candidatus Caldarchaeum sp.]
MAMDLNVYKIRLVFESPVALPFRRARLGYLGIPKHIPAATLRGSVIAALYRERMIDEKRMRDEAMYPSIIASPAYPVINGLESKPAHPFIFQCKKCEAEGRQQGSAFKIDSAERLMSSDLVNFEPPCGHRALKQLHPTPIVFYNGRIVEAGVSGFRYISLNMSRRRAAGVKGVLYSYEALDESHEFWATLASPDELGLDKLLLLMGRGISRGMGRVRVSNSERVDVSKEAEKLSNTGDGQVLFTAISPLLGS